MTKIIKMNAADTLLGPGLDEAAGQGLAIICNDTSLTYRQLNAAACRAGNAMAALGVKATQRVLIMADDRPEFFIAYLGAMKIGAVPVALNLRFSMDNLAYIMADSDCQLILADGQYIDTCKQARGEQDGPPLEALDGDFKDLMDQHPDTLGSCQLTPTDMAFWMYTSGTTGKPKAVVHCQKSIIDVERYLGPVFGVGPGVRIFCTSKLFFAFSMGHTLMAGLRLGATIVLHTGWPSPGSIADVIERHRPSVVFSVPTLYRALLEDGQTAKAGFESVNHFISAGEHLPRTLFDKWLAVTGKPILQGIGASETLIMFIGNSPGDYMAGATGKPFAGTQVKLVSENGQTIEDAGIPGVLWVRSQSIASQYWNRQNRTETAFRDDWYVTSDVFFVDDDGFYHYQGRDDDMLKISGQWVSPAEIEHHVLNSPQVSEACVIGVEDTSGLIRLAVCLVPQGPKTDHQVLEKELMTRLKENLSIYKCPRRFIFLDDMPRTATGKVQRFVLRQIAADYLETS